MTKVTKAVIAAAGFGTRFLPQTKAMPKEMLPLVDKPIIQYVVEDLVAAGIKDIIIVTGSGKRSLEDHFDTPNQDLVNNLRASGTKKEHYIEELEAIANLANFVYVRQKGSYGNARPIMNVRHLIGEEPFIYTYADDLIVATPNRFQQMIALYEEFAAPILPCIRVEDERDFARYGIMSGEVVRDGVIHMNNIVEKPGKEKAPSNYASIGGYLLTPDIFAYLEQSDKTLDSGLEFQVQPSMRQMMAEGKAFYACQIQQATYYDTGDKLDYIKTVFDFALEREDIGPALAEHLRKKLQ